MICPVIMAGGTGSRLWPLSRRLQPKQFLSLMGDDSLLQETLNRLHYLEHDSPTLICNEEHRFLVAEQVRRQGLLEAKIFLEPEGRNTAPAIAVAALEAMKKDSDALLLVLAADHLIKDVSAFLESIERAEKLAVQGNLVTFGIEPTHAETGYGYIKCGENQGDLGFHVDRFVEKPDLSTAKEYLASGHYYWNSGIFLFSAKQYLEELELYQPEMVKACRAALSGATKDLDFLRLDAKAFTNCPAESVDYAVMERTDNASMVILDAGWSDIGSWSALWEVSERDDLGNACRGDVMLYDSHNSLVYADHRLVTTVGIENLVVVETKDAVLVGRKEQMQDVKKVVEILKGEGRSEQENHREVYRPWGVYDTVDNGPRYQVKRITVNPGAKLSVQMHHHRAEHWVVVSGTAKITVGEETKLVTENQSVYIPIGKVHALENPGKIPLELIEVQSGPYLGEDDIVRFIDLYGRC